MNENLSYSEAVSRPRRLLLAMLAIAGILALVPAAAAAGTYQQHFCHTGYPNPTANSWSMFGAGVVSNCDGGSYPTNGLYGNLGYIAEGTSFGVRANAPAGARYTKLATNLRIPFQSCNRRTFIEGDGAYHWSNWNCYGGTQDYNLGGAVIDYNVPGTSYFTIGQVCSGSGGACNSGDFYLSYLVATLEDVKDPTLSVHNSGLFESARTKFRGSQSLTADLYDDGKGIQGAEVLVDGAQVMSERWGDETCNLRLATPCANRVGWSRTLNSAAYTDGVHTIRVRTDDGVGNAAFTDRAVTFDNTKPQMGPKPAIDGVSTSGDDTTFQVSASDATAGLARIEQQVNGGAWTTASTSSTANITVTGAGAYTVNVRAVDEAGNVSDQQTIGFTLLAPPTDDAMLMADGSPLPGTPGPGDVVRCGTGTPWSQGTSFTYQWTIAGAAIPGATNPTYVVTADDARRNLACEYVATNQAGSVGGSTDPVTVGGVENFGRGADGCYGQAIPRDATPCGDFDGDGIRNVVDEDDDGDRMPDSGDAAPYDPGVCAGRPMPRDDSDCGDQDGDAIRNGEDGDDDNDGTPDAQDTAPFDPTRNGADGRDGKDGLDGATGSGAAAKDGAGGEAPPLPATNGQNASRTAVVRLETARSRNLRFGQRVTDVVVLRDEDGRPIAGAQLSVLERLVAPRRGPIGAGTFTAVTTLNTDKAGRVRWIVPAGPSRTIRYAYKANTEDKQFTANGDVTLLVTSAARLKAGPRALRNGRSVNFTGRVRGAGIPRGGVLVELQAWRSDKGWFTFKTVRARHTGRFTARYRFTRTVLPTTYRFRAKVGEDSAFPYRRSTTSVVKVRVRP